MREILFRGKCPDNGKWVEGFIVASRENTYPDGFEMITVDGINYDELDSYIPDFISYAVDPSTVGQYTGLKDKNGNGIWEGDIVELFGAKGSVVQECGAFGIGFMHPIDYDLLESKMPFNNSANFCFNDNFISLWEVFWNYEQDDNPLYEVEIIGNIHDNPELLEK